MEYLEPRAGRGEWREDDVTTTVEITGLGFLRGGRDTLFWGRVALSKYKRIFNLPAGNYVL
jgi:hypothetical protein